MAAKKISKLQNCLELIKQQVRLFLHDDDPSFSFAMVMIAASFVGTSAGSVAAVTGYTTLFVEEVETRLVKSGLWNDGATDYQE